MPVVVVKNILLKKVVNGLKVEVRITRLIHDYRGDACI